MSCVKSRATNFLLGVTFVCLISFVSDSSLVGQSAVVVDVVTIKITPSAETLISQLAGQRYSKTGSDTVKTDINGTATSANSKTPVLTPNLDYSNQVRAATVDEKQIKQVLAIAKATEGCAVLTSHQTSAADKETAVHFAGEHYTYCTSHETTKARHGSTINKPVYEVIEDGTVVTNQSLLTEDGVQLNSTISINKLIEVSTFTYNADDGKPLSISLPRSRTHEIKFDSFLKPGSGVLIQSDYVIGGQSSYKKVEIATPVAKVPYINRLFKSTGIKKVQEPNTKTIVLVSVRKQ